MKILTIRNLPTKNCIELRADDQRIQGYKGFVENVKVGDHITYIEDGNMWWQVGLVVEIKEGENDENT